MTFLMVLKTVGKICLCSAALVLLFLALLLVLLLFVPVRYEMDARLEDPEGSGELHMQELLRRVTVSFHFRWLFSLVRGGIDWPRERGFIIRILWFRVDLSQILSKSHTSGTKETKAFQRRSKKDTHRGSMKETLRQAGGRITAMGDGDPAQGLRVVISRAADVVRPVLPREWSLTGTVGLGDPAAAGTLLEIEGMLMPLVCGHVWITPEPLLYRFDLTARAEGRVRMWRAASAAFQLMKNFR